MIQKSYLTKYTNKQDDEIVYVTVEIQDEYGNLCTQDSRNVVYSAKGAEILGIASGCLTDESIYTSHERNVYRGRTLVALKKLDKSATLTAKADGLDSVELSI